jgi:amino-acid N-acetyltransferase
MVLMGDGINDQEASLMEYLIRKAVVQDVPQMQELINGYARDGVMLPRSLAELYDNVRDFMVCVSSDQLLGCSALHVCWIGLAEIASFAVRQDSHHHGIGAQLLHASVDEAAGLGIDTIFTLTRVPDYFRRHGFVEVDKGTLPQKIWSDCIKCPKFPDCDEIAMTKRL